MKASKPKAKALRTKRKTPLYYNPAEEQRILRVQSGGRCECAYDWIHGRKGEDRCPHVHGQPAVAPKRGPVILTVRFMGRKHDYTKAKAYCWSCNMEFDKVMARHQGRKKKAKVEPGQVGMFEDGFFALEAVIWMCATLGLLSAYILFSSMSCSARAKAMGFKHTWGLLQGCMIETKSGVIDIEKYRVIE
jgi:hypothetical protein